MMDTFKQKWPKSTYHTYNTIIPKKNDKSITSLRKQARDESSLKTK